MGGGTRGHAQGQAFGLTTHLPPPWKSLGQRTQDRAAWYTQPILPTGMPGPAAPRKRPAGTQQAPLAGGKCVQVGHRQGSENNGWKTAAYRHREGQRPQASEPGRGGRPAGP
ncbi:hypothetical protein [Flavonifractor phage Cormatin]|nr:hypothetical protein [Flavonifractor phage Cormatin]